MKNLIFLSLITLLFACNSPSNSNNESVQGTENSATTNNPTEESSETFDNDKSEVSVQDIDNPATAENPTAEPSNYPVMTFEKDKHEFGDVLEGAKVVYEYKFTNTGKANLLIDNCEAQCGCTVPEWPKAPIKPGEKGKITVEFNSSGKAGFNTKTVTIYSNVKEKSKVLTFTANVYSAK